MPPARTVGRPSLPMPSPLLTHWGAGTWSCSCWSSSSHPSLYLTQNLLQFFFGFSRFFFYFQEQSRNCRDGDFDGQRHRTSPSPPKMPRRQNPRGSAKLFLIFSFSQSQNTTAFFPLMCSAHEKSHKVPWPRTPWNITGVILLWPRPSCTPPPLCNPRVRAWKDCTLWDHFLRIFHLFHYWKGQRSFNYDLILCHISQPLLRFMNFLTRKHQCWTHPQAELCHTSQNSKALDNTSPLSALKKGFCYLSPYQCHHWSNQNSK